MDDDLEDKLNLTLMDLDFTVRTVNGLESIGIRTVGDLVRQNELRLRKIPLFNDMSLLEVTGKLRSLGLRLGMDF